MQTGRRGLLARRQLEDEWVVPHLCAGTETTQPRVPTWGNKASKPLTEKNLWGLRQQEKLPASQESSLETPTGC